MLNEIYTVLFILSFIMLIILISFFRNRISVSYVLMFVSVLFTNFGYMQLSDAANTGMALYANQTVYLGAAFCPFLLLMCIVDLCKVRLKKGVLFAFIIYGCFIFFLVSTVGALPWYYKSVSLVKDNGISYFAKEHGPLHFLYPLYLVIVMVLSLVFIIRSFAKKKEVSYLTSTMLLVCMSVVVVVYAVEKILKLHFTILPFAYVFAQIGALILLRRISLYDVSLITADSMVENATYGFVIYDSKGRYLGADEAAKNWFPELHELQIDAKVKSENTDLLLQAGKWIRQEDNSDDVFFERGERIIEAKHVIINERKVIHCIYLRDDTKQQKYTKLVENYNENLEHDVNEKTKKIYRIQDDIIISMASIVENRDSNTGGHIARTSDVVKIFVNHLKNKNNCEQVTPKIAECIIKSAPLHDFGKIAIPDVILNKPGKFEPEEYEIMKQHSAKGATIVAGILQNSEDTLFKKIAVNVAHYHHEKWDGNGYPDGLKEEEIPFEARVMALADVFDALVSKRVYKERFGYDKAFTIIEESCGTHFDPYLCREFLECRPKLEKLYDSYED